MDSSQKHGAKNEGGGLTVRLTPRPHRTHPLYHDMKTIIANVQRSDVPTAQPPGKPIHLKYLKDQLDSSDVERLAHGCWYNDQIVNTMAQIWVQGIEKAYSRSNGRTRVYYTWFANKLMGEGVDAVIRWDRHRSVFDYETLIIPLNVGNNHWAVLIVDGPGGYIRRLGPDMKDTLAPTRVLPYTSQAARREKEAEEEFQGGLASHQIERLRADAPAVPWPVDARAPISRDSPKIFIMDSLVARVPWDDLCKRVSFFLHTWATIQAMKDSQRPTWASIQAQEDSQLPTFVGPPLDIPRWRIQVPQQPNDYDCGPYMLYNVQQYLIHREEIVSRCTQRSKEVISGLFDSNGASGMRQKVWSAVKLLDGHRTGGECVFARVEQGALNEMLNPAMQPLGRSERL